MDVDAWNERYATNEYVWTITVNRFVEEHLAALAAGTAIDLAAGEGRNAVWLAARGWHVVAVDFSDVALDKGRRLAREHGVEVEFVLADATTWEPHESVDLVVLSYLQLRREQRLAVLARAAGWVKPGGTVFVIAHDRSNVADGYGGPSSVEVCYDPQETAAALAGLEVDTATVVQRPVETDQGTFVALDTLVVARRPDRA